MHRVVVRVATIRKALLTKTPTLEEVLLRGLLVVMTTGMVRTTRVAVAVVMVLPDKMDIVRMVVTVVPVPPIVILVRLLSMVRVVAAAVLVLRVRVGPVLVMEAPEMVGMGQRTVVVAAVVVAASMGPVVMVVPVSLSSGT